MRLPAKGYARHGESWSYALALRLASYDLLRAEGNEPVLVLDDVFAELDARRRERLAELVAPGEQVLVTAAVDDDVPRCWRGPVRGRRGHGGARMSDRRTGPGGAPGAPAKGRRAVRRRPRARGPAGGARSRHARVGTRRSRRSRRGGGGLRSGRGPTGATRWRWASAINRLITERGWETPAAVGGVMGRWPQIVGEDLAKHCVPERYDEDERVLSVRCDSTAWATQLRLLAPPWWPGSTRTWATARSG